MVGLTCLCLWGWDRENFLHPYCLSPSRGASPERGRAPGQSGNVGGALMSCVTLRPRLLFSVVPGPSHIAVACRVTVEATGPQQAGTTEPSSVLPRAPR